MRHTSSCPTKHPFVNDTARCSRNASWGMVRSSMSTPRRGTPARDARDLVRVAIGVGDACGTQAAAHTVQVGARTHDVDGVFVAPVDGQHEGRVVRRGRRGDFARVPARAPRSRRSRPIRPSPRPSRGCGTGSALRPVPHRRLRPSRTTTCRHAACSARIVAISLPCGCSSSAGALSPTPIGSRSWESRLCRNEVASGPETVTTPASRS